MFNVQRYDPVESGTAANATTATKDSQLSLLHAKIAARQQQQQQHGALRKRSADEAFSKTDTQAVTATTEEVGGTGWRPAPGESPAEREKRIKREKRQARLAQLGQVDAATLPAAGKTVSFAEERNEVRTLPPAAESTATENNDGPAVHPSRANLVPDKKASSNAQALTPARKRYLKKKKERSKAKKRESKAGPDSPAPATSNGKDDSSESEGHEDDEALQAKRETIAQKKAERRKKRLEKKAIARAIKNGEPVPQFDSPPASVSPVKAVASPSTSSDASSPAETVPAPPTTATPATEAETAAQDRQTKAERRAKKHEKQLTKVKKYLEPPSEADLIPTMPSIAADDASKPVDSDDSNDEPAPQSELNNHAEGALLRLPAPKRPAKADVVLPVHDAVKHRTTVDPSLTVSLLSSEADALYLSSRAKERLAKMGVKDAFAVQAAVWPILMSPEAVKAAKLMLHEPQRDLCVAAPTGSGKTLAYVVPIVEALRGKLVTRLRALVILPTRDLVSQVRDAFEKYAKGSGLRVATATGAHSFAQEQSNILGQISNPRDLGTSQADVLICTPGRLMDHLRSTPRFTLQHLQFLVVDEADRLMGQSFQEWLPTVLDAVNPSIAAARLPDDMKRDQVMASSWLEAVEPTEAEFAPPVFSTCRKMLFSATLSRDPAQIDALKLHKPIFIAVESHGPSIATSAAEPTPATPSEDFTFPETLKEHYVVSPSTLKPLYLLHLVHSQTVTSALCFTRSVDAANRLTRLVELFEEELVESRSDGEKGFERKKVVKTFSSDLAPSERQRILSSFKGGQIDVLVCSDIIARGIDLPSVSHVISYDVPTDMRSYVHRVGRTARAGKKGDAWSLVEDAEVAPFRSVMRKAGHWDKIERVRVKERDIDPAVVEAYERAMEKYSQELAAKHTNGSS